MHNARKKIAASAELSLSGGPLAAGTSNDGASVSARAVAQEEDEAADSDSSVSSFVPELETTCCLICYEDMTNDVVSHCVPASSSSLLSTSSSTASSSSSPSQSSSRPSHNPHPICGPCLGTHVASLVSEHKIGEESRILCVVPDCEAHYSEAFLNRAVAPAVMDKRSELERNWNLEKMERSGLFQDSLEKLVRCPVCAYPVVAPKTLKVFKCPNEECQVESCLECGKLSHIPMSCDEANTETLAEKISRKIAEAMTNAVVRNCPECSMPVLKDGGCNKIHCEKCGVFSCYLCGVQLSATVRSMKTTSAKYKDVVKKAYAHFCQTFDCGHESCGMCALYDKSGQDVDKIKSRIAGEEGAKEAEAYLVNECGKSALEAHSIVEPIKRGLLKGLPSVPADGASSKHRPAPQGPFAYGGGVYRGAAAAHGFPGAAAHRVVVGKASSARATKVKWGRSKKSKKTVRSQRIANEVDIFAALGRRPDVGIKPGGASNQEQDLRRKRNGNRNFEFTPGPSGLPTGGLPMRRQKKTKRRKMTKPEASRGNVVDLS